MHGEPKPSARSGLLTADHSKRGRRFVTILDPGAQQVTLLEPWEHAILVLCDGTRQADEIALLLDDGVQGEPVTLDGVRRCLKFFERQALIEPIGLRTGDAEKATGPRTLANLQLAYREWHKDPVKTGQILAGDPDPFIHVSGIAPIGLSPTVALPDDDNGGRPVAVGTTLVLGNSKSAFDGGDRPLRSVFETSGDARTEIGALDDPEPAPQAERPISSVRAGGSAAQASVEDDLEELELGDVADLLAAVDSDFDELDEQDDPAPAPEPPARPPVGRAVGGEASVPPAQVPKTPGPATKHEKTQRLTRPEASLTPTMVGYAPEAGAGGPPVIVAAPRSPSVKREIERVGAVIGPTPSESQRNITQEMPLGPVSTIEAGAVVEDTQRFDLPTDAGFAAHSPLDMEAEPTAHVSALPARRPGTAPHRAQGRRVFDRLWALGLQARALSTEDRTAGEPAERFQRGLDRLTAGELEHALAHVQVLLQKVPRSTRLRAFSEAVRTVLDSGTGEGPEAQFMLDHLIRGVEDTLAAGRCPSCLSATEQGSDSCASCGFSSTRADAACSAS